MTKRRTVVLMAASLLGLAILACGQTTHPVEVEDPAPLAGPYPPYWICASATPVALLPPPTQTPLPGLPTSPPGPTVPPPEPPTPTPHYRYGEFYLHQAIWLSNRWGPIRLVLAEAIQSYVVPEEFCWQFVFHVRNFSEEDFHVPLTDAAFIRDDAGNLYTTEPHVLRAFFNDDQQPVELVEAGAGRKIIVPICHPPEAQLQEPFLGVLTDVLKDERTGSLGHNQDATVGADSAIYLNLSPDPFCGFSPPDQTEILWPQIENPPSPPQSAPWALLNYGGRIDSGDPIPEAYVVGITRGFGCAVYPTGVSAAGRCPVEYPYWHTGIDYSAPTGSPVFHIGMGGIRSFQGWSEVGYGNLVIVGAEAFQFYYAHLSGFTGDDDYCPAGAGNGCNQGYQIGYVGSTGMSTGPHLHFEVRVNGLAVDPQTFFGGSQGAAAPGAGRLARMVPGAGAAADGPDAAAEFVVRMPDGSYVDGITVVILDDMTREEIARCPVQNGTCSIPLPPGVYPIELEGFLPDGRAVAPAGARNVEMMQSGAEEYLFGPMAFYHSRSASTVGIVLLSEGGQAGPYFDADPSSATPVPVVPKVPDGDGGKVPDGDGGKVPDGVGDGEESARPEEQRQTRQLPTPTPVLAPQEKGSGDSPLSKGVKSAALLVVVVIIFFAGVWLRRRFREKRRRERGNDDG